ncbi:adhesion G-protein coupled receptor G7 [Perognathus longimembris pacificus]|uniref:adhesion G-protein coupled receptor G7 n=1 Tax=Perognathus longimembris pacificus TaxID=214514 RepID=UPI002019B075|nr:adhesion G-protein coupled receptor G7 [Perognathus longimembris pacificus]
MPFFHACNRRMLVAIACGLLTAVVLGLSIWRIVIRIHRGTYSPPSSTTTEFCRNGGTWENGRCICTEEWRGLRCTIVNFCENSTFQQLTFARIAVGRYGPSLQTCGQNTPNAGKPLAIRLCTFSPYGEIKLENATRGNCNESLESLEKQIDNITTDSQAISTAAQILTSNTSGLTAENIISASTVVGQIFNESRNASPEAKKLAVTTVSQLLDVRENVFQIAAAANNNTFTTLIEQMENYSLTLYNESVVEPNVAIQSFNPGIHEHSENVRFSVQKGSSDSLVSGSIVAENVDKLNPDGRTELQILLKTKKSDSKSKKFGFVVYQNNKLFQSKTFMTKSNFSQKIISGKVGENEKDASVEMVFNPRYNQKEFQLYSYACVYWNLSTNNWDTYGCNKTNVTDGFLGCECNHTTNFAVLMSFKKNYQYPKSLDILSILGCALSIAGLALTIIFQIVTRKVRKTTITWVLVNLCTSMLIFNLFFVFGIENTQNKNLNKNYTETNIHAANTIPEKDSIDIPNPSCTVFAALLHYFLLVTFTWNGLNAVQFYFLLIRTMKPLPSHFILFISLIGWGVPAIIVGVTVGTTYAQNMKDPNWELEYRQEEICWLAILNRNGFISHPFLWSLLIPITIILIINIGIFIIITVKVLWKNNQNLTSTKKVSSLKKILSTLSIAVVFGLTWSLSYLMLINNDDIRIIFSYIFCLANTTQGLQLFILYTVRTKIFQNEASKALKSLSSSFGRVKPLPSMTPLRLRVRMYNMLRSLPNLHEHFRFLEPSLTTEETTLTKHEHTK